MGCDAEYMQHKCEEQLAKLKQDRDEAVALVEVMRDALDRLLSMHVLIMGKTNHGASFYDADCFREMNEAPMQAKAALSITGTDALAEIQARTLEDAGGCCASNWQL